MRHELEKPALIVPFGKYEHPGGRQVIDRPAALRILQGLRGLGRDMVVDYLHESFKQCGPAPAAGWVKTETARLEKDGIYAMIDWTDDAVKLIEARKYLYLSPVFEARSGGITRLVNLGLTNNPNINAMPPLIKSKPTQERQMRKKTKEKIMELLGVPREAGDETIVKAVESLMKRDEGKKSIAAMLGDAVALLGLDPEADNEEVKTAIRAMAEKAASGHDGKVERMVNDAISAGRLRPSQREWAISLGGADPESFRMFLINSGPPVPVGGAITRPGACVAVTPLTESEEKVLRLLNISEDDYRKYGA